MEKTQAELIAQAIKQLDDWSPAVYVGLVWPHVYIEVRQHPLFYPNAFSGAL